MTGPSTRFLAILAYITVGIAWGTTYGGIRVAVEEFPPFAMAAFRFLLAGIVMLIVFRAFGIRLPPRRDWKSIIAGGVFMLTCANGLLTWAEQYIDSAFAALLVNTAPFVFVALSSMAGNRVPRLAWAGLAVGFLGILILIAPDLGNVLRGLAGERHPMFWWAVLALVVGPSCWATGSFITNQWKPTCNPLMVAATQTIIGGAGGLVIALLLGEFNRIDLASVTMRGWGALAWLIIVGSWMGYVAYAYCLIHLPAHRTATVSYVNNVVAILVGAFVLGENITLLMVVGGVVLLAGVYIVQTARQKTVVVATRPDENGV